MSLNCINIYFVRHSQAEHNIMPENLTEDAINRINNIEDPLLTENGFLLIDYNKKLIKDINFTAIYCSPLKRCIQTANLLVNNKQIYLDDRLLEIEKSEELKNHNKRSNLKKINSFIENLQTNNTFNLDEVNDSYIFKKESKNDINRKLFSFLNQIQNYK